VSGDAVDSDGCSAAQGTATCTDGSADDDGDGICNNRDRCNVFPLGDLIDSTGCTDVQVDQDGDGRCDIGAESAGPSGCVSTDICSSAAAAAVLDAYGCTRAQLDTDGDGVCDIGAATLRFGVCIDTDSDGTLDASDNCQNITNAAQTNTDAANTPASRAGSDDLGDVCDTDDDGDGYTDVQETTSPLAGDPLAYCAIMRADVDGDHAVSILDLTKVGQKFGQTVPPAPERYSQDADNQISILDLTKMGQLFIQNVSACP
jgi:hypothetical protein